MAASIRQDCGVAVSGEARQPGVWITRALAATVSKFASAPGTPPRAR